MKLSETASKLLSLIENQPEGTIDPVLYAKLLLDSLNQLENLDASQRERGWNVYHLKGGIIHAGYWNRTGVRITPRADGKLALQYGRRSFQDLDVQEAHELVKELMPELFIASQEGQWPKPWLSVS